VNFLNIGPSELMVILAIAILAIGPKRMVEIARTLGRATGKLRKISGEFMAIIQAELQETGASARELVDGTIAGEAGVEGEVTATGQQAKGTVKSLKEEIGLASLQAELQETERATREFLQKISVEEEEEGEEDLAETEGAPPEAAQVDAPMPEAVPPEQTTTEEKLAGPPEAAAVALETATEPTGEIEPATPGTALVRTSPEGELAEPTGAQPPAPETAIAEAAAPEEPTEETQLVPAEVDQAGAELQELPQGTLVAMHAAAEGQLAEPEADVETEVQAEPLAVPEPVSEMPDQPPLAISEDQEPAEQPVAPEAIEPAEDVEAPEEQLLSPEEEARVRDAVALAAGLAEPEQVDTEKAKEDDRQE
jgi:Sec-independent protein translocase protein TatA